ncbi:MAG: aminotransferase class V-fold PLP-dependent enzyme [Candidatus Lokiarchaeota archaeon]|nr:aminotransferase class V-fold PLP-dependent enzyme [Candidatus Lokiarchaeota archaeon]MBD3338291.1 aminotransferase class V-fold PLP-dependent enzyme [Candidatus Lokiarchaeota archaeon]
MGPGPSCVPPEVYTALSCKTLGHLDPYFIKIMDEIQVQLQKVLNTTNELTLPISGTGSAGMETCLVNLIESKDPVLVLTNGVFGVRMQDVASRLGADVDNIDFEWGTPVIPATVKEKLTKKEYKIVAIVHAETSTGVMNPVDEIGKLLNGTDTLFLVDTVTSLGGIEVNMDSWGVDALYSGTQKCLSCPPGLAPVSFSKHAFSIISNRKTKVPNWYLDMNLIGRYWSGERKRVYHHTAPINMLYALYQALNLVIEEGLDKVYKRHMENHLKLKEGLEDLGLNMYVEEQYRLPMLNAVSIPDFADDLKVRQILRNKHKIEIGAGLGPLAGKIWRIGLMGHTARSENVDKFLEALDGTLKEVK